MTEHSLTAVGVVLDCRDPQALADFWQAAIGFATRTGDGEPYVTLSGSELRRPLNHLTLQRVPEPKSVKNRCHIDLFARDVASEVARLTGLGASVTARMPDDATGDDLLFAQMADPEGNEFCVVASPSKG
jgi:predicted enzyme related to lactoylglutathione lyase